ncbi:unnamed protein product [Didymodactylos carnosus]|uniref:Domain of unknown function with conserved HDNR motif domain-containing protein n=1 Tax=Didymodactylos carnosus TaxID=1234261 RepID=A0A814JCR2_9BILA|nr:unnamed protein product [Didymodactylos carnosus]CAF1035783.1 unnamed protein product [Didymodactylos carnosus]CAF3685453.1 unnamed protein product [Didymodactylos carnosus]CAF3806381.1 unnamed protein product [Didymodactylos carnosus]
MSQVQVRQISVGGADSDVNRLIGSWYSSGYHGHFRSKSRLELSSYFRELAKPKAPKIFSERQNSEAVKHPFSKHDNRFKFESDPLVRGSQAGFGKRKADNSLRGQFDPLFIAWLPKGNESKRTELPKHTAYQDDYSHDGVSKLLSTTQIPQEIISTPDTNLDKQPLEKSVYKLVYAHGQPTSDQSKQIRSETFQRFLTTRTRRIQLQNQQATNNALNGRTTVAQCLCWNNDSANIEPIVLHPQTKEHEQQHIPPLQTSFQFQSAPNVYRKRAQSAGPCLTTGNRTQQSLETNQAFKSQSINAFSSNGDSQVRQCAQPCQKEYNMATKVNKIDTNIARPSYFYREEKPTTTSRAHYNGQNFGLITVPLRTQPPPQVPSRATTTLEISHSMENLISKYC